MKARGLNALLAKSRGEGRRVATLDFSTMTGLMKGFIDLIFEHDGRFYVLDYKSNYLGSRYEDYQMESLIMAMDDHHYDLQYLIYTLALHRYLRNRIPDYDYERHIGGVYYLFLRGMTPEKGNSTGVFFDKPSFELIDALDRLFAGEQKEVQHA
jgi:exodeoxyribonuclease V beta subunit